MVVLSVYNCYICKVMLDGNGVILNCLHILCAQCQEKNTMNTSITCICTLNTEGEPIKYPIVSPNISKKKACEENDCHNLATKICIPCNSFYCKPCSKVHLQNNTDHTRNLMMSYPMESPFILCPNCKRKCVDVSCTKCGIMICSMCHLNHHQMHGYKELFGFCKELVSNMNIEKVELEKNEMIINHCLKFINKELDEVKIQKTEFCKEVDDKIELLKNELDKRGLELKKNASDCAASSISILEIKKIKLDHIRHNNEYVLDITDSILNHKNKFETLPLTKFTTDKLKFSSKSTLSLHKMSKESHKMEFDYETSMINVISSIKSFGKIYVPESPKKIDPKTPKETNPETSKETNPETPKETNPETPNNQETPKEINPETPEEMISKLSITHLPIDNNLISNIKIPTFNAKLDHYIIPKCSCCDDLYFTGFIKLTKCNSCKRNYHNNCHIPSLESIHLETLRKNWKCTMCQDIIIQATGKDSIIVDINSDKTEWKIIERILLELYCQSSDSVFYNHCPNKEIYPEYYKKISKPMSLDKIKKRLVSDMPYETLLDFIIDVKLVFSNGKLYYHENDPYYKAAVALDNSFNSLLIKFLPELHYINLNDF